jgi:hypothetical protein
MVFSVFYRSPPKKRGERMNPFLIFSLIVGAIGTGVAISKYEKANRTPAKVASSLPTPATTVATTAPSNSIKSATPTQGAIASTQAAPQSLAAKAAAQGWNSMDAKSDS